MIAPVDGSGTCPAWIQIVGKRALSGSFMVLGYHRLSTRMRLRLPQRATAGRPPATLPGTSPAPEPTPTAADLLLRSRAGRLFMVSALIKVLIGLIRRVLGDLPTFIEIVSGAATLGLIASLSYFLWRLFVLAKRRLL